MTVPRQAHQRSGEAADNYDVSVHLSDDCSGGVATLHVPITAEEVPAVWDNLKAGINSDGECERRRVLEATCLVRPEYRRESDCDVGAETAREVAHNSVTAALGHLEDGDEESILAAVVQLDVALSRLRSARADG